MPRVCCTLGNRSLVRFRAIIQKDSEDIPSLSIISVLYIPLNPTLLPFVPSFATLFLHFFLHRHILQLISCRHIHLSIHVFLLSLIFVLLHLPCPQCSSSAITIHCSPSIQLFSPHYKRQKHPIDHKF